ncbi:MAG: hypothetical protein JWO46_1566, partial [Nocardioidaceae bacterium]|nr:hypothetical protein [Nocardioidaceae bacterium]
MSEPRPAGRLALDCLMIAVLTVVALTQLDQTYSDRSYLVAGCLALAVAMLLAVFVSESGRSVVLFIVLAVGAYVLLGPVIALRSYQDTFLPTPADFLDVLVGPFSGWNDLLTIIPPVEPTGRELVVPYALCFAAGATSTWLALRTNLVALPVLPIVGVLSAGILLGVQQPDLLEIRAAVLVVGIVVWLAVRGRRLQDSRESDRAGSVLVTTVLVGLVCAGVVIWLAPTTPPQARVVLHGRVGQGADLSNLDNPLSSFRIFTRQQAGDNNVYDERLLRVGGLPAGQRLRFVALDTYDGSTMEPDNRTVPETVDDLFQRISHEVDSPEKGSTAAVGVRVLAPYRSSWVPTTGALTGFQFVDLDRSPQREDLRYNPATRTLVALKGLRSGDDYTFTSTLTATEVTRAMAPYPVGGQLQREAAFLDPYIKPWAGSAMTPMQKVYSLARYLRKNGRYSDGAKASEAAVYTPGHGEARLGPGFIGAPVMVGDDEQYAAFMALAASRLGVPARVVVGAVPTKAGYVYGRNVLVWVELRVADGSWRTFPTAKFMSHVAPKDSEPAKQPPGAFVQGE